MIPFNKNILPRLKGAYVIGGSVRDLLLGRIPTDYDIAVTGNPEQYAKKLIAKSDGHLVRLGKPGRMIIRVISGDMIFDITSLNGTSIEDDLNERDFTINAIAYDLYSEEIIDCLGGLQDLANKKVRMVSREIFKKDPARLIRAYRIGACLNFEIETKTAKAIKSNTTLLKNIPGERIRVELFTMLGTSISYLYLSQMAISGLLTAIFPDLERLKGCFQNHYHHFDGFEHTMRAYDHLETILNDPGKILPDTSTKIHQYIDKNKPALIKCAILLHDIGKPLMKTLDSNGKCHFYGHARKSADMAQKISQRLRFSNHERQFIDGIIRNHMKPLSLFTAYEKKTLTQKGITRFYKKCGEYTPALLLAAIADTKAKQAKITQKNKAFKSFLKKMIFEYFYNYQPLNDEPPLITGRDLIHVFGLTPSPLFKKILDLVDDAKLTKTIKNRSEALELIRDVLRNEG
ncbi:MAG: HD domain-containing protein [Desulfobacteraceae bacterium]|nr:HD domain-containing protein [Desulfobacteraceae bacterium]MDH3573928.1 HD domain-containing protein [Desulfobacteraceae bacterium]MDH3721944.1 HD domain-containing protein [Desulfobacteraceae bacterium]MDH3837559.1 HD domain-containing protein [Desulfobacteraceae bacterium]MDH3874047.1 HD domain-containing protein [Desulfobacteraceae bacterium]